MGSNQANQQFLEGTRQMLPTFKRRLENKNSIPDQNTSLPQWLEDFAASDEYRRLIKRFDEKTSPMTPTEETAMLYGLIRHLRPALCLEIGTFFAQTAQIMAEAAAESGANIKVMTLDPFGGDRVPGIIGSWPAKLQKVVEFRSWNSMQYFLELETLGTPKGAESPLGVVFVDGHHNFEYALYDIIRSADHLKPGGAIIVDNLEQEGPKTAVMQFLRWNPAWRMFHKEKIWAANSSAEEIQSAVSHFTNGHTWGVLLAPDGIQIAGMTSKFTKRHLPNQPLKGLQLNLREVSGAGILHMNMLYGAVPYDFHITGKGMVGKRVERSCKASEGASELVIEFPSVMELGVPDKDMNIFYEIELSYQSAPPGEGYVVLDGSNPVKLIFKSR